MDNPNNRSKDFAKSQELDNKRRYINQNVETGTVDDTANKYNIGQLSFPQDVNSEDFPHYVSFFINVRGKSKYNQENRFKDQAITRPSDSGLNPDEIGRAINLAAAGAGAVLGVGAVKKLASLSKGGRVSGKTQVLLGTAGAAGGALAGIGASSLAQSILKPDQSFRISDVITLAVQEPPAVSYEAKYNDTSLGLVLGALGKTFGAIEQSRALALTAEASVLGLGSLAGAALGAQIGKGGLGAVAGGAFGAAGVQGAAMQSMTKMKTNPFREMLFEQISYRDFKFNYRFLPKSRAEVDNIKRIIDTFKFHMHPELSAGNLFFIYPAEFQIIYYFKNKENSYFHKIAPSALTSLNVTYGTGAMSSFHDGTPTEVNLSLNFQEMELLTKEKIELGY